LPFAIHFSKTMRSFGSACSYSQYLVPDSISAKCALRDVIYSLLPPF
jgi:hypothetical protein